MVACVPENGLARFPAHNDVRFPLCCDSKTTSSKGIKLCQQQFGVRSGLFRIFNSESLILAQNERWRQASYMQVERTDPFGGELAANG